MEAKATGTAIPTYDPTNQVRIMTDGMEDTQYTDPALYTMMVERTRALREMNPGRAGIRVAVGGDGLLWAFTHMDREVGMAFQAHGIAKLDGLVALDTIFSQGFQKDRTLYTASFLDNPDAGAAIGADHPFTEQGIVLVSAPNKQVAEGVRYIVVGEEYSRVIDLMRARYPQATIVPWHDAPRVLTEAYNQATGHHRSYESIDPNHPPTYAPYDPVSSLTYTTAPGEEAAIPAPTEGQDADIF